MPVDADFTAREKRVLAECEGSIRWYSDHARLNIVLYRVLNGLAIALAALTPVLVLGDGVPKMLQATPSVLAVIFTGLSGFFQCRENWVRYAYARESLREEKFKYEARLPGRYGRKVENAVALDRFGSAVVAITFQERSQWKEHALDSPSKKGPAPKGTSQEQTPQT